MTSSAAAAPRRLVLVPSAPRTERDGIVRRYRLARLRLEGREVGREQRFDHSKRSYD